MITKWKLFNFKSVRDETELELAPLTILAGPNSSGKSTWTQSMLLISQTLASKVSSRSVVLNGHLTKLGQFDDLRSFNSEADQILIGWECEPRMAKSTRTRDRLSQVACQISFDVVPSGPQRDLMQLQPRLFSCELSGLARGRDNIDTKFNLIVNRATRQSDVSRVGDMSQLSDVLSGSSFDYSVDLDPDSSEELFRGLSSTREIIGCKFSHFLPMNMAVRINKTEEQISEITAILFEDEDFVPKGSSTSQTYRSRRLREYYESLRFSRGTSPSLIPESVTDLLIKLLGELGELLLQPSSRQLSLFSSIEADAYVTTYDWLVRFYELSEESRVQTRQVLTKHKTEIIDEINRAFQNRKGDPYELELYSLPRQTSMASNFLNNFFSSSVKYLGPLRDEPKPIYPLAAAVDPSDIGLRGEYTAAVLDLHKEDFIAYLPTINFSEPVVKTQSTTRSLEAAVVDWLQYMGVAEKVETRDRGKLGHELKVTTSSTDKPQDLTHVGVGVSQVLPILVMCLLADEDTTLIIEQPELHLHPKVQTLLADFFLSMALLGKQCIIETHSEYVINRLRFRAASAAEDALSSIMKIYFVEKNKGVSSFRDVVVNKYGAITDWPEGFFDQSQDEAEEILRAATLKRKKERGAKKDA